MVIRTSNPIEYVNDILNSISNYQSLLLLNQKLLSDILLSLKNNSVGYDNNNNNKNSIDLKSTIQCISRYEFSMCIAGVVVANVADSDRCNPKVPSSIPTGSRTFLEQESLMT